MSERCHPGKSAVHGLGLFASDDIKAGEVILEFHGVLRRTDTVQDEIIAQGHWQGIEPGLALFPQESGRSLFFYINHSDKANASVDLSRRTLIATEQISMNSEIFVDYRLEPYDDRCRELIGRDVTNVRSTQNKTHERPNSPAAQTVPAGQPNRLVQGSGTGMVGDAGRSESADP